MYSSVIHQLLDALLIINKNEDTEDLFPQELSDPEPLEDGFCIPCLDGSTCRIAPPMLVERYNFAGRWGNAYLGQTWLSISDMATLGEGLEMEQIRLRRLHYENSVISSMPLDRLSLFGIDTLDGGETYLYWADNEEPEILQFCGGAGQEDRYLNFFCFLSEITGR